MGAGVITEDYLNAWVSEDQSSVLAATRFCRVTVCISKCRACSVFTLNGARPCSALLGPALPSVISQKKRPRSLWLISETGGSPWPITEQRCRRPSCFCVRKAVARGQQVRSALPRKIPEDNSQQVIVFRVSGFLERQNRREQV